MLAALRSTPVNSVAAQEFGSDYTDPYLVRAAGASIDFLAPLGFQATLRGSYEHQSAVSVNATPVVGQFEATIPAVNMHANVFALELNRPSASSFLGTELSVRAEARAPLSLGSGRTRDIAARNAMNSSRASAGSCSGSIRPR